MTCDWIPVGLEPIVYRLARADELAFQISERIAIWSFNGPLELENRPHADGTYEVVVAGVRPIPPDVPLMFSESIHHIRAALDNVVWHMVDSAHGPLDDSTALKVAFPINDVEQRYRSWVRQRVKAGLTCYQDGAKLGDRIRSLQPFADTTAAIPNVEIGLAEMFGNERELAHPLRLLQEYSNSDKHRQVRVGVPRTVTTKSDRPILDQGHRQHPIEKGDVLHTGEWGTPTLMETNTAVMIARPHPYQGWTNPAKEVAALRQYVADVAIPVLLTGIALPAGIPPHVDLGDTGTSDRDRLFEAGHDDALARFVPKRNELLASALGREPECLAGPETLEP